MRWSSTASNAKPAMKKATSKATWLRSLNALKRLPMPSLPVSGVPVVPPWVCGVAVATFFPEASAICGQELNAIYPLGALPGVQLGRNHPHRAAVLSGQRLAVPLVDEEHV